MGQGRRLAVGISKASKYRQIITKVASKYIAKKSCSDAPKPRLSAVVKDFKNTRLRVDFVGGSWPIGQFF